ncbi:ribosome maturation factor RimM [Pseudochrobactrum algeriensis]|uniref:ribosome maturation factor RimM n=1 Tax=Pseudochrobactrum algeriensis TaxID=2834768 RepID=UPI001BCF3F98|nr:ribosome maturation factor RimM [Pseudochrobactrum algeriensis]MBX8813719.1 ribosome maturation factor RimM [Ochrobactrum sp. MR34]QVQ36729.1 ribosome maturation factor RimM [Pseudochrobactrum algeriensis]QVQ39944.1 ribosome maturation factor RimM [Pseudochrobactrum algeriensis]QVQ43867.1 ribosome maturation factor RimM [Pseudochrobactrum algeriensis]
MSSQKKGSPVRVANLDNPVQLAVIGAAHGIKGEVRVKTYTGDPMDLGSYGLLYDASGKSYEVLSIRPSKTVVVVRFAGVEDRNAAEALNGKELYVDHAQLPQDLDEDEFYYTDLIGLAVRDSAGVSYGKVSAVFNFGGGDVLEIKESGKKPVMIPFTLTSVPEILMEEGAILIDPLAAGLVDDGSASADEEGDEPEAPETDDDGWAR